MITTAELRAFIEIADKLNISAAAQHLGLAQPSLSKTLKNLEQKIGLALFIRHPRGLKLTRAGERLQQHSFELTQAWSQVHEFLKTEGEDVRGHIVIGAHPILAQRFLVPVVSSLLKKYPGLSIELDHDKSDVITSKLNNLMLDLAIVVNPMPHPDIIINKLAKDQVCFWRPKSLREQEINTQTPLFCSEQILQSKVLLRNLRKKSSYPSRIIHSTSYELIRKMCANGAGICILPESFANKEPRLVRLEQWPTHADNICLIYRKELKPILLVQVCIKAIKQSIKV